MEWISVKDSLPKERCLAFTPDNPDLTMMYRIIPEWMFKQVAKDATHWMPLPDPPLESEDDPVLKDPG